MTMEPGRQFDELSFRDREELSKNPQPGMPIYRSEARPDDEDLEQAADTGAHWTTHPTDFGWGSRPGLQNRVVWHGVLDDVSHVARNPKRIDGEGEVVLRPDAQVRVVGRSVTKSRTGHVQVTPGNPEIPMDAHLNIQKKRRTS